MNLQDLANAEADRIENDDSLTDDEKRRFLLDLGDQMDEVGHDCDCPPW